MSHIHKDKSHQGRVILEEVPGLIRVYDEEHVERPQIVPNVPCNALAFELGVTAKDVTMDKHTSLWARIYVPNTNHAGKHLLPLLVYFHGGGFCVGSASWNCYHEFLANLAAKVGCVIVSVNYRLAPENRLPVAYEDGFNAMTWIKQQALNVPSDQKWWLNKCNLSNLFLAGDSAGANLAHHIATRLSTCDFSLLKPLFLKGIILIQPFFGGESRTMSEKHATQPPISALTLSSSDTYWRLSLPLGASRDHPWCNPLARGGAAKLSDLRLPKTLVCISELDILKDRNLEFCSTLSAAGKKVETVIHKGVGHAFQILSCLKLFLGAVQVCCVGCFVTVYGQVGLHLAAFYILCNEMETSIAKRIGGLALNLSHSVSVKLH
ncbi:Alpha/beta hydrolase fold-3 [Dillenia turbinata]|uniref:Alpha/beta hydrolase fold-3 n=1 Tax=Dillenia turbinata TaxID=194707 RepID=A0AAN8VDG5_9MAGN